MKDHELRELINDVTAVARIYAHTQQLREQISHLIVPIFAKAQAEIKAIEDRQLQCASAMRGEILTYENTITNLNRQLDFEAKQRTELRKDVEVAKGQYQGACDIIKQLERNITPPTPIPSSDNTP